MTNYKKKIKFILTVDTEEEWDWSGPFPESEISLENIKLLPKFQAFCDEIGIKPTYFIDYAVINDQHCANIINTIAEQKRCELGLHLHPWCNPPYNAETDEFLSHVVNLPLKLVESKLNELTDLFLHQFGRKPYSFRTGRWGINGPILKQLIKHGIKVDSSIYPLYKNKSFDCEDAPIAPYWPSFSSPTKPSSQRDILEVPITAGFNRQNFERCNNIHKILARPPLCWLKPIGILWHTCLLRKIYLSPELSSPRDMSKLIHAAVGEGNQIIHMYMHSSSLLDIPCASETPYTSLETLTNNIRQVMINIGNTYDVEFCTISDISSAS